MSYLVLARKWRPQNFEDIVGQEHVTKTLKNAIKSERVAHAYLFTGARGVGKTSAARILAKALNCEKGPTTEPCGNCGPCREISAGNSVDIQEIDGASNTSVDDVRDLKESINYLPSRCKKKIYIIDEVHMLSTSAFNALLKTLEEPPSHVVFIFATTEPHKIPGTILSRCQRFDFKRIPLKLIFQRLKDIACDEGVKISDNGLMIVSREADGGMRDAQSLLDQVISFAGNEIKDEDITDVLGVIDRALIHETIRAVIEKDPGTCLKIVENLFIYGWDVKEFGKELLSYFRNLAVVKVAPGEDGLVESTSDEIDLMVSMTNKLNLETVHLYFDMMAKGMEDIVRSLHPKISLEMLLLKLASIDSLRNLDELITSIEGMNEQTGPQPAQAGGRKNPSKGPEFNNESPKEEFRVESPAEEYSMPDSSDADTTPNSKGDWKGFVNFVKKKKGPLGSILEHSHLISFDDSCISIAPTDDFSCEKVKDEVNILKSYALEYLGSDRNFDIQALDKRTESVNSIHEEEKKRESDKSRKLKKEAEEHPMVVESLDAFDGKVEKIITF